MSNVPLAVPMTTNPPELALVRRTAWLSLGLAVVGAAFTSWQYDWRSGVSVLVGAFLGVVNLWGLTRLVLSLLDETAPDGRRGRAAFLLSIKFIVLVSAIGFVILRGYVRGGSLMAGLSLAMLSMVLVVVFRGSEAAASQRSDRTDA